MFWHKLTTMQEKSAEYWCIAYKFITRTAHGLQPANLGGPCIFLYIAGVGGIDFIDKLVLLFLRLFLLSRNAFGDEFSMAEVFYREHWSNLYHKLQNKRKIKINRTHFSAQKSLLLLQVMCWKCLSVWLLAIKTVLVSQCYMKVSFLPFLGLLCDLLWSDPDKDTNGWGENDRGVSFTFGADVVSKFLNRHDLDLICRAHQVS